MDVFCNPEPLPNTFTPNGDGHNDVFPFDALTECTPVTIRIFNRWGNLVFQSEDPYATWDGGDLTPGVYYYKVNYDGGEDAGHIELVK